MSGLGCEWFTSMTECVVHGIISPLPEIASGRLPPNKLLLGLGLVRLEGNHPGGGNFPCTSFHVMYVFLTLDKCEHFWRS